MSDHLSPVAPSDFAEAEREKPLTPAEQQAELLEGDFASGQRTVALTPDETLEASHHGDFAGGERTEPPEDDIVGTFEPKAE